MRWHTGFTSVHLCFSQAVVLWSSEQQRLITLDLVRQRICMGLHLSLLLFFGCSCFIFLRRLRAITVGSGSAQTSFFHSRTHSALDWSLFFLPPYLCWNTVETLYSCSMLLSFSSFSHNHTAFFLLSFSPRDYASTLSLCSIQTVSNS